MDEFDLDATYRSADRHWEAMTEAQRRTLWRILFAHAQLTVPETLSAGIVRVYSEVR